MIKGINDTLLFFFFFFPLNHFPYNDITRFDKFVRFSRNTNVSINFFYIFFIDDDKFPTKFSRFLYNYF